MPSGAGEIARTTEAVKAEYAAIAARGGGDEVDRIGLSLIFAEGIAAIIDGVAKTSAAGGSVGGLNMLASMFSGKTPLIPNPICIANGHDDAVECPLTESYLRGRTWKGMGGTAISLSGMGLSAVTGGVNVFDVAAHSNATGSTAAHLLQLGAMAHANRKTETIARWLKVVIAMKTAKATVRGAQAIGSAIPAASLGVGVAGAVVKFGIKLRATNICLATAMEIHWRAYVEQKLAARFGGAGKQAGPATRIFAELFERRGLTRIFGQYDSIGLINEPAGWQALGDKILLI